MPSARLNVSTILILFSKASENEVVAKGVGMMKALGNSIQKSFQDLRDESMAIAEQKRAADPQRQTAEPVISEPIPEAAVTETTTATTTTDTTEVSPSAPVATPDTQ